VGGRRFTQIREKMEGGERRREKGIRGKDEETTERLR